MCVCVRVCVYVSVSECMCVRVCMWFVCMTLVVFRIIPGDDARLMRDFSTLSVYALHRDTMYQGKLINTIHRVYVRARHPSEPTFLSDEHT